MVKSPLRLEGSGTNICAPAESVAVGANMRAPLTSGYMGSWSDVRAPLNCYCTNIRQVADGKFSQTHSFGNVVFKFYARSDAFVHA